MMKTTARKRSDTTVCVNKVTQRKMRVIAFLQGRRLNKVLEEMTEVEYRKTLAQLKRTRVSTRGLCIRNET
ncbi:hypothetical protein [Terasakiella pusilla]|uniref:hypothetical protein n=1 Tax=Terasakiella pusilla TaxID=64973 RepID=UPI003AA92302